MSPNNTIKPNIGSLELAEALNRVLPFTATDKARAVLQCVLFTAKEGKLQLISSDGFTLAIVTLDYDEGEGKVLVNRDELKGIAGALRKAKRVRLTFQQGGEELDSMSLVIDTELIRYRWQGSNGDFPNYEAVIPTEFKTSAHFDTVEAIKAIRSIITLGNMKQPSVDLNLEGGNITLSTPDIPETRVGQAVIPADIEDKPVMIRLDGKYLTDVLKACGGMVDFKLLNPYSAIQFAADGCQVTVMPVMSNKANEQQRQDIEAKRQEAQAEPTVEAEAVIKSKPKRSRSHKREPVAVA